MWTDQQTPSVKIVISTGRDCGSAEWINYFFNNRYQTLTLPEDKAGNGLFVNGSLIHRKKEEAIKSDAVSF